MNTVGMNFQISIAWSLGKDHSFGLIVYCVSPYCYHAHDIVKDDLHTTSIRYFLVFAVTSSFSILLFLFSILNVAIYLIMLFTSNAHSQFFQDIPGYMEGCMFLPKLNNEDPSKRNATYKERLSSLQNLVLIMVSSESFFFFSCLIGK